MEIEPIKPHIGAIVNTDRASLCDQDVVLKCQKLLEDRVVLVFPRLGLSDHEQLAFTDRLGLRVYYANNVPGGAAAEPDIYKITLDPEVNDQPEYVQSTFFWHFDGYYLHTPPPKATLLSARRVAPAGGQTEFANTYAAYEHLPRAEKAEIENLRAIHSIVSLMRPLYNAIDNDLLERWTKSVLSARALAEAAAGVPEGSTDPNIEKEQPVVWTHATGRKSLAIGLSADRIARMPLADGRAVLSRLLEWTVQPDFRYRHEWQEGDLVIWNNGGALHRVIPYGTESGRSVHRTTIAGTELIQ